MSANRTIPRLVVLSMLLIIGSLSSCRELVEDEFLEFNPTPTINSILETGRFLEVHVSMAAKMDTQQLESNDNAEVILFMNGMLQEKLTNRGDGLYLSSCIVEPGNEYLCHIKIPGYKTLICSDNVPYPCSDLQVSLNNNAGIDEEGSPYSSFSYSFISEPCKPQYYEIILWLFNEYRGQITKAKAPIYTIIDPILLNEGLPLAVFSNELINGDSYTMTINYRSGSTNKPMLVEFRSISYDFYTFLKQEYLYKAGRYPDIFEGVTGTFPLHSNVENGYGIFAAYSSVFSDTIYP